MTTGGKRKKKSGMTGRGLLSSSRPPSNLLLQTSRNGPVSSGSGSGSGSNSGRRLANGGLSSKATRTLIRAHHTLHKQLAQAEGRGDEGLAGELRRQIEAAGGLDAYQRASIQGQSAERGGDSSRVLVEWVKAFGKAAQGDDGGDGGGGDQPGSGGVDGMEQQRQLPPPELESCRPLRLLEVGSLRVDNACARSGLFEVERIDLHSQHRDILQQDFMDRPVPCGPAELQSQGFDVISLSLVVNYVPEPAARGNMLQRTTDFLRGAATSRAAGSPAGVPGLFLVLPAPCVLNSRYLNSSRLQEIMESLGYEMIRSKTTNKLVYYYYYLTRIRTGDGRAKPFQKQELVQGKGMNNFAIVIK